MNLGDTITRKLAEIPKVSTAVGVFVGLTPEGLARVNVQGSTVDVRLDGWNPPIPGMPVRVETLNGIMRVKGPSQALATRGEVIDVLGGGVSATVLIDGDEYTLPVMAPYSPMVTDTVVVNWQSGHILGEEASAPETSTPDQVPSGGVGFNNLLIQAHSSGKYDDDFLNWYGSGDVRASNNNVGAWFYSGRFASLAGANISRIEIYLPPPWRAVGALFFGLHGHPTRPGGDPGIGSLVSRAQRSGWLDLPDTWGNLLRDNPTWGIGVTSGAGDNQWPGVPQDGLSGALRFTGTR